MAPSRVLLTGANGFIGAHILEQLLHAGISVRSVLRSQAKIDAVKADFPSVPSSQLDFAVVPDITTPGAFDEALKSTPPFDAVVHTASPFLYSAVSAARDFLDPAVKGTTEILRGITRASPSVKRVVITSSYAAIGGFGAYDDKGKVYSAEDWNPSTWDQAVETKDMGFAYRASKKFAEKAGWDFVSEKKPGFDLVVLNPPMVYGPLRHTVASPSALNQSNLRIYDLFLAPTLTPASPMPINGLPLYVDVRDIAQAHILALTHAAAGGKRFLITPGPVASQQIADVLRATVPGAAERTPKGEPGMNGLPEGQFTADATPAREILGLTFRSVEETFSELGAQLLEIERKAK